VFSDLRHSEAFIFFAVRARYEKRFSTAKGLLLEVFFSAEGHQGKNTFGKTVRRFVEVASSSGMNTKEIRIKVEAMAEGASAWY
jgi:hypothetical protein